MITWNLALDPQNGPHNGGCDTCMGVVTIDPATGEAKREGDYYVLGQVTKFVKPGAVRIGSTVDGNDLGRRVPQPRRLDRRARQQRRLGHRLPALQPAEWARRRCRTTCRRARVATFVLN